MAKKINMKNIIQELADLIAVHGLYSEKAIDQLANKYKISKNKILCEFEKEKKMSPSRFQTEVEKFNDLKNYFFRD